ncbi:MAG: hypothetical protein LBQ06_07900, partial [Frankiaceae bacterium]|nr:hypothetical protein [Frankiaceae bacterium]
MTSPDDHPDMETGDPVLRELLQLRAGPGPTPSAELEEVFRTGIPAAPRRAWRQVWLVAASAAAVILAIEVATTSLAGSPAHQPPATVPTVVGVPGDPLPATDGPVGELVTPPAPVDEPAVPPPVSSPSDAALPVPDGPL